MKPASVLTLFWYLYYSYILLRPTIFYLTRVNMATTFDVDHARSHFTALRQKQSFMDNAGGSQILDSVADSSVRGRDFHGHVLMSLVL